MGFAEYKNLDLVEINRSVLEKWKAEQCFENSLKAREGAKKFVFFEGPPSANGMPGIHHVMARAIKDAFCRFKTQSGYLVQRKAGWDTHGLPVELGVEKMLGITKEDIGKKITVDEYNDACRKEVMKYTKEWVALTERIGYWVDMDNPYITYDNKYIETLWHLLKDIYGKGLLYKGYTIQPYSPAAGTGLSSHELNQPGCYRDVKDTTVVGQFKIKNPKAEMAQWGTPYFLAWTTTPWTLPSNVALCVGPKIEYVAVQTYNSYTGEKMTVVLAKNLLYCPFDRCFLNHYQLIKCWQLMFLNDLNFCLQMIVLTSLSHHFLFLYKQKPFEFQDQPKVQGLWSFLFLHLRNFQQPTIRHYLLLLYLSKNN